MLISGGHSQYLIVKDVNNYKQIGTTIDDALGEAFDKTAKILGFGFPGGPKIEQYAKKGNQRRYVLPKPIINRELARMLSNRNVTDIGVAKSVFGITPKAFSEGIHHLTGMNVKNATDHLFRNSDKRFEAPKNRE